jgi:FtsH-binding integral membrane protein
MAFDPQGRYATGQGANARTIERAAFDEGLRQYMLRIYWYMAGGLLISGITAALVMFTPLGGVFLAVNPFGRVGLTGLGWVALLAPIGLIFWMSMGVRSMSASTLQTLYWAFVALQGIGLAPILMAYTGESVVRVFFITAASFAGLSLYGYTTKRSLSAFGSFLIMGLFGIVIASIVNIFLASTGLAFVISVLGVLIFAGLIAYDTQRLKEQYAEGQGHEVETKTAVWGALTLYLNFLNLFLFLLRLLGNRN